MKPPHNVRYKQCPECIGCRELAVADTNCTNTKNRTPYKSSIKVGLSTVYVPYIYRISTVYVPYMYRISTVYVPYIVRHRQYFDNA